MLNQAERDFAKKTAEARPTGLIIDGIRNVGEIEALAQWRHFYLISVQADQDVRKHRILQKGKCIDNADFLAVDKRDAEEQAYYGQQVKQCDYLSDIVVNNDTLVSEDAEERHRKYIGDKLYDRNISFIERIARGEKVLEHKPQPDETLMTICYAESKRSSCLKRKVGAVITTEKWELLSSGHNDVPEGAKSCLEDQEYGWCARDVTLENMAQKILHCPSCGTKIELDTSCYTCGKRITSFKRRCQNCKQDPSVLSLFN